MRVAGLLTLEQQMGNKIEKPKGIVRREKPEHMPNRIAFRNINEIDATKLPTVLPKRQCFLRVLRLDRTKDYLQMEQEFIARQHAVVTVEGLKMEWYIPILSIVDKDLLCVNALVLVRIDRSRVLPAAVVGVLDDTKMNTVALSYKVEKAPKNTFEDIGGCEAQIQELKESVELPLTHPEYYEEMGISAPKGVILYGEPGTGKTLLAKAIANSTKARFIRATGADFVKKEPGEGAKLVRSLFKLARESAPCIVFLDEIDAVGTKRFDSTSRGKTKMIDEAGISRMFQASVKSRGQCLSCSTSWMVSMLEEMSRIDSLDPALIRSGRIDRKIEFTKPDDKAKQKIYSIHTSAMSIAKDVTYENTFGKQKTLNGAEIKAGCLEKNGLNEKKKILQAICSEAGMLALRQQRKIVMKEDFVKAIEKVLLKTKGEGPEELYQ
ncbi:hypothetical protein WR25_21615 [Diploscapter pachys]|uniref:AAA+ ATPase domain-containing protein n=1 Tax=Diploscapter pachys TaxID=2018661 RepID=A0A2A2LXE4_9BILA|nr:hypothetical protein WR25_21615 [Diploscapter pachys]